MNALVLALAYLRYHWARSAVLVAVAALILWVPLATRIVLTVSQDQMTARADDTPLILGSRGSALDLVMAALYFSDERPPPITMAAAEQVWDSGLAVPIPLYTPFRTEGFRIVGTSLDYFDFRRLALAEGRGLAVLGEAVIGAGVARATGKGVGDALISSPQTLFDISGSYPLQMPVVGVLAPTGTVDDDAVFVDIKTTWVIAGIGHGHEDVVGAAGGDVAVAPGIREYNRITPETADSFHFHGDPDLYPATALIVDAPDLKSQTILRGRYLDAAEPTQMVAPGAVVQGLVARIFRIRSLLDAVTGVIGAAALAAVALAVFLSYRLRDREMTTAFKIGARRGMIVQLLVAETALLLGAAGLIAAGLTWMVQLQAEGWTQWLLSLGS